jgi:hypothetical protein
MSNLRSLCMFMKEPIFWMGVPLLISFLTLPLILKHIAQPNYILAIISILYLLSVGYFISTPLIGILTKLQLNSMYGPKTLNHIEKWISGESADKDYDLDVESIARSYRELTIEK